MAQQIQQMVLALQQSLVELTQEVQQLKAKTETSTGGLASLKATSEAAWGGITARIDAAEKIVTEVKGQMHSQGAAPHQGDGPRWNLEHKGALKEYNGDKKTYRPWAKKVMAFCNSKADGFRKTLIWAEKMQHPITDGDLGATGWPNIMHANTKLYDLLSLITSLDALAKVEATPGESQGFEAWRRLARQCMPTSRLTRIDRLNQITHTEPCNNMREVMGKIEQWEQSWSRYEVDNNVSLDVDLKLGALLKMLPAKEKAAVQLRYIEDESKLTYDVLRRQVEHWLESLQQGPVPMDLTPLDPIPLSKMTEEQLEEALDVLRKGGKGRGRDETRGGDRARQRQGGRADSRERSPRKGAGKGDPNRKIVGNCWNCDQPGHTSAACKEPRRPKGAGRGNSLKSVDREGDDDDGEDQDMGMLGINSFEEEEFEIIDDDILYEYIPDPDGPPPLMIEIDTDDDLPLTPVQRHRRERHR